MLYLVRGSNKLESKLLEVGGQGYLSRRHGSLGRSGTMVALIDTADEQWKGFGVADKRIGKIMGYITDDLFVMDDLSICHASFYEQFDQHKHVKIKGYKISDAMGKDDTTKEIFDLYKLNHVKVEDLPSSEVSWSYIPPSARNYVHNGIDYRIHERIEINGLRREPKVWFWNDYRKQCEREKMNRIKLMVQYPHYSSYYARLDERVIGRNHGDMLNPYKHSDGPNWYDPISWVVKVERIIGTRYFLSDFGYICNIDNYSLIIDDLEVRRKAVIL